MTAGNPRTPAGETLHWREERERSPPGTWRLFAPALVVWAVAACAVLRPAAGWGIAIAAATCGGLALMGSALFGRGRSAASAHRLRLLFEGGAVGCALLVLLGSSVAVHGQQRADPEILAAAERREPIRAAATLSAFPQLRLGDDGAVRSAWATAVLDAPYRSVPVVLWLGETEAAAGARLGPGSRVLIAGTAVPLEAGAMSAYGIRVDAFDAIGPPPPGTRSSSAAGASQRLAERSARVAADLRNGLRETASRVSGAELLPGFAVGDTSLVSDALESSMKQASTVHVTAVSGANIGLLTACVIGLVSRLGFGRRLRILAAAIALGGFVIIVGPDSSVQRAAIMAVVMLVSDFGGHRSRSLPALGLAMNAMLIADPWQALQPGFALSVAATAGILLIVPALERGTAKRWPFAAGPPRWLVLPVAVALSAQLACGPLLLLLQPGIPAAGILANCLIETAAPLGTGLGLAALVALPLSAELGDAFVRLGSWPASWVAAASEIAAGLPAARWAWPGGWPGALLLTAVEGSVLVAWLLASGRFAPRRLGDPEESRTAPWAGRAQTPLRSRSIVACLVCAALGVFAGPTLVVPIATGSTVPADWSVVACDVGQGDALLLRDGERRGEVMLVDTGDDPEKLRACLDRFGVSEIALLVLTHDDRDHVGALGEVVGRTREALVAPANALDGDDRPVLGALGEAGVPTIVGASGMRGGGPAMSWEVLAPDAAARPADANSASLVLAVQIRGLRALLLADTGEAEQRALRASGAGLRADIVKIAHHGSRDRDAGFAAEAGAALGLVSVGAENRYGHPAAETLDDYASTGTRVLRTDEHGSIAISFGSGDVARERWRIWLERAPERPVPAPAGVRGALDQRPERRLFQMSKATASSSTMPLIAICHAASTARIDRPMFRTPITRPPMTAPTTVPTPPCTAAPPMNAAAIASSS